MDDIASDGSTININKAVKMVRGKPELGPPKSKRSIRIIPVPREYIPYALYLRNNGAQPFLWTLSSKHFNKNYK